MTKISALIITHNEAKHIGACIDSLAGVTDEVIVIDSGSDDQTAAIARAKGAKVIEKKFEGFGGQKNYGAAQAANDYILSIDADEVLSAELHESITGLKQSGISGSYYVNRLNHIAGRAVRSCGWYPDIRTRLYDRRKARWDDKTVHEELITTEKPTFLSGDLLHFSYDSYEEMKVRADRYGKLAAASLKGKGTFYLVLKIVLNTPAKFLKSYILQKGFIDGYAGWMISRYKARETFMKYYLALK